MILMNVRNGATIKVDKKYSRVRRCQKRVHAWAETLNPYLQNKDKFRLVMVTLTYRPGEDWKKNDIREFMLDTRQVLGKRLVGYSWVAEMQLRGAVHYHVLLLVKKGTNIPMPDKSGLWDRGMSKIATAKSPFYIVTYTGKEYQKLGDFPKGLRLFAVWIDEKIVNKGSYWTFKMSAIPGWFQLIVGSIGDLDAKYGRSWGGGWHIKEKVYKSPWKIVSIY